MNATTVVIVNDFGYVNGGASQVALTGALGLARAGYDVRLFVGVPPITREIAEAGIRVTSTGQQEIASAPNRVQAAVNGIWNRKAASLFRGLLADVDRARTVVHVHSWTKVLSSSVFAECADAGVALTCTLHDYFSVCPNGGLFNYQTSQVCGLDPMSLRCVATHCDSRRYSHKLWRVLRQKVQGSVGKLPSQVQDFIVVSKFSQSILERHLARSTRFHLVQNPVDAFQESRVPAAENENVVYVGRLAKEKGPLVFARAANRMGIKPVFVGDGELCTAILNECPSAVITGWVGQKEVAQYLRKARALVFPSLLYETQGLAVLEALARGIPAVVSTGTAAAELVTPDETGFCFTRGDDSDLTEKLRLLMDPTLVERLSKNAYERYWAAPLDVTSHITALGRVYESMLQDSKARHTAE